MCEWIVSKDMTVGQAKKEILAEIKRKYDIDIPYERCRLRKKYYKTASKVFLDEQKFEDLRLHSQFEIIIQELPDKETVTDTNQIVLFVRRWLPAKLELEQFQEIVLENRTIDELRKKVSRMGKVTLFMNNKRSRRGYNVRKLYFINVLFLFSALLDIRYSGGIYQHSEGKGYFSVRQLRATNRKWARLERASR